MILGFSTQHNGKETNFVSKIWRSLVPIFSEYPKGIQLFKYPIEYKECVDKNLISWYQEKPKHHSLRDDPKDRRKAGMMIDFFINVRTKKMFRFAPRVPVVSTQKINIKYHDNCLMLFIDDKLFYFGGIDHQENEFENYQGMLRLAQNDGFETIEDFFAYFDKDCVLKLIHWTDLRY